MCTEGRIRIHSTDEAPAGRTIPRKRTNEPQGANSPRQGRAGLAGRAAWVRIPALHVGGQVPPPSGPQSPLHNGVTTVPTPQSHSASSQLMRKLQKLLA